MTLRDNNSASLVLACAALLCLIGAILNACFGDAQRSIAFSACAFACMKAAQ